MNKHWTDMLSEDIYNRLANCRSQKKDILPLAQARWNFIKENKKYEKEDAIEYVLELLDCNECYYDLTYEEYDDVLFSII